MSYANFPVMFEVPQGYEYPEDILEITKFQRKSKLHNLIALVRGDYIDLKGSRDIAVLQELLKHPLFYGWFIKLKPFSKGAFLNYAIENRYKENNCVASVALSYAFNSWGSRDFFLINRHGSSIEIKTVNSPYFSSRKQKKWLATPAEFRRLATAFNNRFLHTIDSTVNSIPDKLYKENFLVDQMYIHPGHFQANTTILYILREIYGEDRVFEIFNRVVGDDFDCDLIEFQKLFKNWGELRDYPLDWILEVEEQLDN